MRGAQPGAMPPWHLWGTTQRISLTTNVAGDATGGSIQIARINYKRPETWSFFFGVTLIGDAPLNTQVGVSLDLIIGVGRSVFRFPDGVRGFGVGQQSSFCRFVWQPVATGIWENNPRWTTQTLGSPFDDAAPTVQVPLQWFPAQDIQASSSMVVAAAAGPVTVDAEITAYFAPRTHVRPDWFIEHFLGNELGGT